MDQAATDYARFTGLAEKGVSLKDALKARDLLVAMYEGNPITYAKAISDPKQGRRAGEFVAVLQEHLRCPKATAEHLYDVFIPLVLSSRSWIAEAQAAIDQFGHTQKIGKCFLNPTNCV
jgi:hypothetical protein